MLVGLALSVVSISGYATTLGLNLKNNQIVKVLEANESEVKFRESGYRKVLTSSRTDLALAVEELDGIERFERVLFEIDGKIEISRVGYVFENGLVMVSKKINKFGENQSINYLINKDNIIDNVEELNGFKVGGKACLKNAIESYSSGTCGKINRVYENGMVELITLELGGVRSHLEQYDFLLSSEDLETK